MLPTNPRDFGLTKEELKNILQILITVLERNDSKYNSGLFTKKDPNKILILKTAAEIFQQNFGYLDLNTQTVISSS
jgi:hypothetical protein